MYQTNLKTMYNSITSRSATRSRTMTLSFSKTKIFNHCQSKSRIIGPYNFYFRSRSRTNLKNRTLTWSNSYTKKRVTLRFCNVSKQHTRKQILQSINKRIKGFR